jgi:hypothetical protein
MKRETQFARESFGAEMDDKICTIERRERKKANESSRNNIRFKMYF